MLRYSICSTNMRDIHRNIYICMARLKYSQKHMHVHMLYHISRILEKKKKKKTNSYCISLWGQTNKKEVSSSIQNLIVFFEPYFRDTYTWKIMSLVGNRVMHYAYYKQLEWVAIFVAKRQQIITIWTNVKWVIIHATKMRAKSFFTRNRQRANIHTSRAFWAPTLWDSEVQYPRVYQFQWMQCVCNVILERKSDLASVFWLRKLVADKIRSLTAHCEAVASLRVYF